MKKSVNAIVKFTSESVRSIYKIRCRAPWGPIVTPAKKVVKRKTEKSY